MKQYSQAFIGFDTAKKKHAVAIAGVGRESEIRYLGEIDSSPAAVERMIRKLAGRYEKLHFWYEAGPTYFSGRSSGQAPLAERPLLPGWDRFWHNHAALGTQMASVARRRQLAVGLGEGAGVAGLNSLTDRRHRLQQAVRMLYAILFWPIRPPRLLTFASIWTG